MKRVLEHVLRQDSSYMQRSPGLIVHCIYGETAHISMYYVDLECNTLSGNDVVDVILTLVVHNTATEPELDHTIAAKLLQESDDGRVSFVS